MGDGDGDQNDDHDDHRSSCRADRKVIMIKALMVADLVRVADILISLKCQAACLAFSVTVTLLFRGWPAGWTAPT